MPPDDHVLVYPRLIPFKELGIPSFYPAGDERTESRLFPDPTRTVGVRDYRPGDPLKAIHWKAKTLPSLSQMIGISRTLRAKTSVATKTKKIANKNPERCFPKLKILFTISLPYECPRLRGRR
jgi:hypothetical protein